VQPYESIDWNAARFQVSTHDLYSPHTWLADRVFDVLRLYERVAPSWLRKRALTFVAAYIDAEDMQTNYVDIGPVNKIINMLAVWHHAGGVNGGSADPRFHRHAARLEDYLWVAEDGMKMQGYNGSQLWDTTFAVQAMCESGKWVHAWCLFAYLLFVMHIIYSYRYTCRARVGPCGAWLAGGCIQVHRQHAD
jgi:squalene cyclase